MYKSIEIYFDEAFNDFSNLDSKNNNQANEFFEKYGVGNALGNVDKPYERLDIYEKLFQYLFSRNPNKFKDVHKGTPFYIMAWLAFDIKNYEKGLFYIDSAISEDIKNAKSDWKKLPASSFLLLEDSKLQIAERAISRVRNAIEREMFKILIQYQNLRL